ncbi:UDP-N-acetylmuramate--L-alanine ligase [Phycisphaera mikurensis]|nr:UDP-N-acetylmuramate--L-alanine ligase [Phycisphaera mikurensis]MBB6440818.1 UDP-N-acetylmuramate--alanine ligase [Phycisphaera mikurensis]
MPDAPAPAQAQGQAPAATDRPHFVGIAGSGMSGLARLARARGAAVTGSERDDGPAAAALRAEGFPVCLGQRADTLPADATRVTASAAVPADHPELVEARRRGLPILKYAEALGELMGLPGTEGVAVSGTHGKSSTTAMLAHVLLACGRDPSFILGARCEQIGGGSRCAAAAAGGAGLGVLVAEACEFDRSFHHLAPRHAIVLNVEADHLDCYGSLDEIVKSFGVFVGRLPAGGSLLIQHEAAARIAVSAAAGPGVGVETLGFSPDADWRVGVDPAGPDAAAGGPSGDAGVTLSRRGEEVAAWTLALPGQHMAYNAAAAAVTAHRLGVPLGEAAAALSGFRGLDRRMQRRGRFAVPGAAGGAAAVIDDYAHHPTEIDATLRALRGHHRPARLFCVFQPHQHSRTRHLLAEFATAFEPADRVLVPDIYFVRDSEAEREAVTSGDLVRLLRAGGVDAEHVAGFDEAAATLRAELRDGDLVVTMGAGDVWKVAEALTRPPAAA